MSSSDNGSGGLSPIGGGLQPIGGGLQSLGGGGNASQPQTPPGSPASAPGGMATIGGGGAPAAPTPGTAPQRPPAPTPYAYSPGQAPAVRPGGGAPPAAPGSVAARPMSSTSSYEAPASSGPNKILLGIGGGVVIALALVAFFLLRTPPPVPAPTGYSAWEAADQSITCETPNGWKVVAHGKASAKPEHVSEDGVEMSNGSARIKVTVNTVKDLVGGQLLFGDGPVPEAMGGSAANGMHNNTKKMVKSRFKNYKETAIPLASIPFKDQMGGMIMKEGAPATLAALKDAFEPDVRLSEFTADGNWMGLGGKVHGYRASIAGPVHIASVVCQSSEGDWEKLKPAFQHVMASLREGAMPAPDENGGISVPGAGGASMPTNLPGMNNGIGGGR